MAGLGALIGVIADSQVIDSGPPPGSVFQALFNSNLNADDGLGNLTLESNVGPVSQSGTFAVFGASTRNHLGYLASSNWPLTGFGASASGAIRFGVRWETSDPSGTQVLIDTATVTGSSEELSDRFVLAMFTNLGPSRQAFALTVTNAAGDRIDGVGNFIVFSSQALVVAGSTHEIEVNFRTGTPGSAWMYWDGVRGSAGNTLAASWLNGETASSLWFGDSKGGAATFDGRMDFVKIFNGVQHEASTYTPVG